MRAPPLSQNIFLPSVLIPSTEASSKTDPPRQEGVRRFPIVQIQSSSDAPSIPPAPSLEIERLSGMALPATALTSGEARIRVLAVVASIERNLRSSLYSHSVRVEEQEGLYQFDCSEMVSWVLRRGAPTAYGEANGLAGTFFQRIHRIDPSQPTAGWRHVSRVADLLPGDVIAWRTPVGLPSQVSGHVVIAAGPPVAFRRGFLVRVVDSTSYPHGEDSRAGGSGFGYGTMYFEVDPTTGEGIGYGWTGRYSDRYVLRTPIAVGRPLN